MNKCLFDFDRRTIFWQNIYVFHNLKVIKIAHDVDFLTGHSEDNLRKPFQNNSNK